MFIDLEPPSRCITHKRAYNYVMTSLYTRMLSMKFRRDFTHTGIPSLRSFIIAYHIIDESSPSLLPDGNLSRQMAVHITGVVSIVGTSDIRPVFFSSIRSTLNAYQVFSLAFVLPDLHRLPLKITGGHCIAFCSKLDQADVFIATLDLTRLLRSSLFYSLRTSG